MKTIFALIFTIFILFIIPYNVGLYIDNDYNIFMTWVNGIMWTFVVVAILSVAWLIFYLIKKAL